MGYNLYHSPAFVDDSCAQSHPIPREPYAWDARTYVPRGGWLGPLTHHCLRTRNLCIVHYFKATEVVVERDHNLGWNLGVDGDVFRPRTDAVLLRVIPHAAKMFTFREEVPAAERSFASQLKSMLGMLSSPEDAAMLHV